MTKTKTENIDAMLNDTEEDAEPMVKPLPDWIGKKADRLTGQYLSVKSGFIYLFKVDIEKNVPQEVLKDFKGNGIEKIRYQWQVYLQDIKVTQLGKGIKEDSPDIYKKVMDQIVGVGEEFIFEMSATVDKQLAAFIRTMPDNKSIIKMQRKGENAQTRYFFSGG